MSVSRANRRVPPRRSSGSSTWSESQARAAGSPLRRRHTRTLRRQLGHGEGEQMSLVGIALGDEHNRLTPGVLPLGPDTRRHTPGTR